MDVDLSDATAELLRAVDQMFEAKAAQAKGATEPEKMDDKESKSGKDFIAKHKIDKKELKDVSDAEIQEPKERTVKKENMSEFEVIRAILSGKTPE